MRTFKCSRRRQGFRQPHPQAQHRHVPAARMGRVCSLPNESVNISLTLTMVLSLSLPLSQTESLTPSLPSQHGKSASTASGPPTTVGQEMGSSTPSSKSPSLASPTTSRPSTNLKAPANTAAPSPTRRACATVPEWYVGVNTVLATIPSRWIRLRMGMSRWERGRRCRPNGRSSRRPGVGCQANICPELLDDWIYVMGGKDVR